MEYRLEGSRVTGIDSLYDEFNRLFMVGEDWRMGPSLDALNDALYNLRAGPDRPISVLWIDHEDSQRALGVGATQAWLLEKIRRPDVFNAELALRQLEEVGAGRGSTYFELVLSVFADHPDVVLSLR